MDLGNPVDTIVHYIIIGMMTYLGYQDKFFMMSALVYMMHTGHGLQ